MKDKNVYGRNAFIILVVAYQHWGIHAFQIQPFSRHIRLQQGTTTTCQISDAMNSDRMVLRSVPPEFNDNNDSDTTNDEQRRLDLGRSNRRRIRTLQRDEVVDDDDDNDEYSGTSMRDDIDEEEDDFPRNGRFGSGRSAGTTEKEQSFTDTDEWYDFDDDDDDYDDDNEDYDDLDMEEAKRYDLLENIIIPNPLLDSMDPDGTVERLPELLSDPRFWFDMVLFILFLDFLSFAGPQSDPFIDFPWIY